MSKRGNNVFFHEIAAEIKKYIDPGKSGGEFVVCLVNEMLRDPMTEEEISLMEAFNPIATLQPNTLDQYYEGRRFISKTNASDICGKFDGLDFADLIDDLYDDNKNHIRNFLSIKGIDVDIEMLGSAVADIFSQIFHGLAKGIHDVDIVERWKQNQQNIKELSNDRVYCEDGKLYIDGAVIELPVRLDENQIYDFEKNYISALCDVYAEVLQRTVLGAEDIASLPPKYRINFKNQRVAYLSAEGIQRSIREVYGDGEDQFDVLKSDVYEGIKTTYFDDYDNGYRRLSEVLKKVSDVQLTKSKLSLIKNLIGNLERLGIVHILVNDRTIPSWVDPYEEYNI